MDADRLYNPVQRQDVKRAGGFVAKALVAVILATPVCLLTGAAVGLWAASDRPVYAPAPPERAAVTVADRVRSRSLPATYPGTDDQLYRAALAMCADAAVPVADGGPDRSALIHGASVDLYGSLSPDLTVPESLVAVAFDTMCPDRRR